MVLDAKERLFDMNTIPIEVISLFHCKIISYEVVKIITKQNEHQCKIKHINSIYKQQS